MEKIEKLILILALGLLFFAAIGTLGENEIVNTLSNILSSVLLVILGLIVAVSTYLLNCGRDGE